MERQSTLLREGALRMCAYFHTLASILTDHENTSRRIDNNTADELDQHEYHFGIADAARESLVAQTLLDLRWATTVPALTTHMDTATQRLGIIATSYRE